ncbi:MAG: cytochrome c [Pseudomonadota bacterium]
MRLSTISATLLLAGAATCLPGQALGSDRLVAAGEREFAQQCAVCHGTDGKGEGPLASILTVAPADLTVLSAGNDGHFPFERAYRIIDGRAPVKGHGGSEMPVWGNEYNRLAVEEYRQRIGPYEAENVVAGKILSLVMYLITIQIP